MVCTVFVSQRIDVCVDCFFFQAEDGIRDAQESRGLGDVYKRQIEEMVHDDPTTKEFHYKSWWNQFRGPWLQSEKMSEDEIRTRADDAWGCETTALFGLKNL